MSPGMLALLICATVSRRCGCPLKPGVHSVCNCPRGSVTSARFRLDGSCPPPICQEVVGRHLREAFALMPPPPHLPDDFTPDKEHYPDDLLVVMENAPDWLRSCMRLVSAAMRGKGYQVLEKSVLEPATWVKWLGKEVDLEGLSVANTQAIVTRLIACLIITWGRYVSKKDVMRIVGLIGWLGTPATGHLPFLGGGLLCTLLGPVGLGQSHPQVLDLPPVRSSDCHPALLCAP